jgi:hypothetical protein
MLKNFIKTYWADLTYFVLNFSIITFQLKYFNVIGLAEGLGYDGVWYYRHAVNIFTAVDNYHLFRLMPSAIIYLIGIIFDESNSTNNIVHKFQYFNISCIIISYIITFLIAKKLKLSSLKRFFLYCLLFNNFHVLKDSIFNPVMTDSFVLFSSLLFLYACISENKIIYVASSTFLLFSFPIGGFLLQISYLIFKNVNTTIEKLFKLKLLKIITLSSGLLFCALSLIIIYVFKIVSIYTFPDEINYLLAPFSIAISTIALSLIVKHHIFLLNYLISFLRNFKINFLSIVLIIQFLTFILAPIINNNPLNGVGSVFTTSPFIIINLKPLIGIFDNILFFGPLWLLFYFLRIRMAKSVTQKPFISFVSFVFFIFSLKPEARHSIFLLPIIGVLIAIFMPITFFKPKKVFLFLFLSLLSSKFWYPCHLAVFPPAYEIFTPKVNPAIFQEFPIQHYFMFQGPMISHQNYFIWLLVMIPLVWYCWKIVNPSLKSAK